MYEIAYFGIGAIISIIILGFYGWKGFEQVSPGGSDAEFYTVGAAIGIVTLFLWPLLFLIGVIIFFLWNFRRKQEKNNE